MIKIVRIYVFAVGLCIYAASAMAFDLGGILKQVEKTAQQQNPEQNKSVQPSASAQVSESAANTTGFCDRVQTTEVYQKYAKMIGDAVRGSYFIEYNYGNGKNVIAPPFDSSDVLLLKWAKKNRSPFLQEIGFETRKFNNNSPRVYNVGGQQIQSVVAACFDQLLPTDFAYIFLPPREVSRLRSEFDKAGNNKDSTKVAREVTSSGEVIEKNIAEPNVHKNVYITDRDVALFYEMRIKEGDHYVGSGDLGSSVERIIFNFPHWLALIYGGEKVLNITGEEFVKKSETLLNKEKVGVDARMAEREAYKKQEHNKQIEIEKTLLAEKKFKEQLLKGDYSQARSCLEAASWIGTEAGISAFQNVLVTPPNTLFLVGGWLHEHSNSEELVNVSEVNTHVGVLVKLKLDKKTMVFNGTQRALKGPVFFIGTYSSNDRSLLSSTVTPVFKVACVQYTF